MTHLNPTGRRCPRRAAGGRQAASRGCAESFVEFVRRALAEDATLPSAIKDVIIERARELDGDYA